MSLSLIQASEYGHRDVVAYLIESGADGRMHPVTKYSPLYIAAYNGKKEVGRQRAHSCWNTASLSHLRTMRPERSSQPLPAKRPNHAT